MNARRKQHEPDQAPVQLRPVSEGAPSSPSEPARFPDRVTLALLDDATELLAAVGVRLSVVSVDEDRAVLVSEPSNGGVSVGSACDMSRKVLARIARSVPGEPTELVELRCGRRSDWPCTFSLEWAQPELPPVQFEPEYPSLEMLIVAPQRPAEPEEVATPSNVYGPGDDPDGFTVVLENTESGTDPAPVTWRSRLRPKVPPWLRRRWWLLVLCILAGTAGGYVARASQKPMYTASSEVVVTTGASQQGPGDANDANALALTDASILPSDHALLTKVSRELGVPISAVAQHLSASVETGTSVVLVSFDAASPAEAIKGANAVGRAITSDNEEFSAIPNGSLALVQLANGAGTSGLLYNYGLPIGALFGLVIGLIFVMALERADPRADDVEDLTEVTATAASTYPSTVSMNELGQLIGRASGRAKGATIIPLSEDETEHANALHEELEEATRGEGFAFDVAPPVGTTAPALSHGLGPTVLVVNADARLRLVKETVQRLEALGRRPIWAVLAVGVTEGAHAR